MCIKRSWRSRTKAQIMEQQEQGSSTSAPAIVHDRQRLQLCLLHALNNLFQGETTFTRSELNTIASSFSGELQHGATRLFSRLFNAHYNIFTGNYDVNVLMVALQTRGAEAHYCDRRKGAAAIDFNDPDNRLIGFIINYQTEKYSGMWKGRHWAALRNIDGIWYDLDGDLAAPEPIGRSKDEVREFIEQCFAGGSEVLLVLRK
eukprot:c18399_g1_i1 orf=50-658(+)